MKLATNLALVVFFLFSSCATVADRNYKLKVSANAPGVKVIHNSSSYHLPATLKISRAETPITLTVYCSDTERQLMLIPSLSKEYVAGNFFYFPPVGYFVDRFSTKRFYYGSKLGIDVNDTTSVIQTGYKPFYKRPMQKGGLHLSLSLPYVSNFYQQPLGQPIKQNWGFVGISMGMSYTYRDDHFLQLSGGSAHDLPVPIGPLRRFAPYEDMSAKYIALTENRRWGVFTIGYGVHYMQNRWQFTDSSENPDTGSFSVYQRSRTLGVAADLYWNCGRNFNFGVMYMPSFYSLSSSDKFAYQHLLSFDLRWRIPLRNMPPAHGHYSAL